MHTDLSIISRIPEDLILSCLHKANLLCANDPLQVAIKAASEALKNYDVSRGKFESLLATCLYKRTLDDKRRRKAEINKFLPLEVADGLFADSTDAPDSAINETTVSALNSALKTLKPIDQMLLHLRFWEKKSFKSISEMAELSGCSIEALRARVSRALRILKEHPGLNVDFENI